MIDSIHFEPTFSSLIGVVVIAVAAMTYTFGRIRAFFAIKTLAHRKYFELLVPGFSVKKALIKAVCFVAALLFFSVAVMRPKWGKSPQEVVQEGRNIMIALDMSRSMLAKDLMPNRLEFVKLKLRVLLERLGPERVGLVLFSDKAFLHCPFTNDFNAFFSFLDQAVPQIVSSGGTSIAKALRVCVSAFKASVGKNSNKILFLITDGEDFYKDIDAAVNAAKREGIHVFTVGAGTLSGAPVPILDSSGREIGHEKDSSGNIIVTKLNDKFLKSLSDQLGGEFVKVSGSDADINFIIRAIESFEKEKMDGRRANVYIERQNFFSALFAVFMLVEWFL